MKEIVIKVSDEDYKELKEHEDFILSTGNKWKIAVINGTELPKGHKELIDTKELVQAFVKAEENMKGNGVTPVFDVHEITNMILSQKAIVDADKGEE